MTTTIIHRRTARVRRRVTARPIACPATTDDSGFGYSRESDANARPEPVPAGVDLYHFTGRTPRRAAA